MRTIPVGAVLALGAALSCDEPVGSGGDHAQFNLVPESHVVGSGHTNIGITDELREFTFHAVRQPDGSASGSYRIERTDNGQYFIVEVTCLSVSGNTGWVGGIIRETNIPTVRVGTISYFFATDNGEGADAVPDRISLARVNDRAGEDVLFCTQRPTLLPTLTVTKGNVQVR